MVNMAFRQRFAQEVCYTKEVLSLSPMGGAGNAIRPYLVVCGQQRRTVSKRRSSAELVN